MSYSGRILHKQNITSGLNVMPAKIYAPNPYPFRARTRPPNQPSLAPFAWAGHPPWITHQCGGDVYKGVGETARKYYISKPRPRIDPGLTDARHALSTHPFYPGRPDESAGHFPVDFFARQCPSQGMPTPPFGRPPRRRAVIRWSSHLRFPSPSPEFKVICATAFSSLACPPLPLLFRLQWGWNLVNSQPDSTSPLTHTARGPRDSHIPEDILSFIIWL